MISLQDVQAQLARATLAAHANGAQTNGNGGERKDPHGIVTVVEVGHEEEGEGQFKSAAEIAIEELQKKVDGAIETIKLE